MNDISLQIDGKDVQATAGMTVLEAARQAGIAIPTLCMHDALEPYGGCRLCIVEVTVGGWSRLVVSCVYPVADGLVVQTRSAKIDRIRKEISFVPEIAARECHDCMECFPLCPTSYLQAAFVLVDALTSQR